MKGGGKERESEFIMSPACSVGVTMGVFTSVNMFTSVCLCACMRACVRSYFTDSHGNET